MLLFATLLPDLIDKPLAWTFSIIPSGRMLAHSLVVVSVVTAIAYRRGYGVPGIVFVFGYFSHLVGDHYPVLRLGRDYYFFPNMFWPLMSANRDIELSFAANMSVPGLATIVSAGVIALVDSYRRIGV